MQKNPFKKKRGDGYIPPSQQTQEEEAVQPSLATYSLMHQTAKVEEPKNDAVVPGTFGGDGPLKEYQDQRANNNSISNQNSYYNKSPSTSGIHNSASIHSDGTGMLSFNPSNLGQMQPKAPAPQKMSSDEMPGMSFGGNMLAQVVEQSESGRQSLI